MINNNENNDNTNQEEELPSEEEILKQSKNKRNIKIVKNIFYINNLKINIY